MLCVLSYQLNFYVDRMIFTTVFILFLFLISKKHTKIDILCFSCVYFTTVFMKRFLWWANLKIFPRASKPSWIWYDSFQIFIFKMLWKEARCYLIISVFIKNFKIFLIMKRIEKIVRFGKFFRSCQMKVCTTTMSNFIKIREVLLWFLDIYFWALIPDMRSQQKRGSDVQVALTFKRFEPEFPDTTQMKDLSKSFLNITNFN